MTTDLPGAEMEIRDALERSGHQPLRLVLISPLGERKGMRFAFRVETHDGQTLKARHCGDANEAQRIEELRRGLEDSFAPVLERIGAVLLEEWVEGEMLDVLAAEEWVPLAGALLGRLHARPLPTGVAAEVGTARRNETAEIDLDTLQAASALTAGECRAVRDALRAADPVRSRVVLNHKDFCVENMLIDGSGQLRIIDTEQLAFDSGGFDLGWTWHRWPMSAASWARFVAAYRSSSPWQPFAQHYWRIVTGLILARVFMQRMPKRLDAQLARLRQCVAEVEGTAERQ